MSSCNWKPTTVLQLGGAHSNGDTACFTFSLTLRLWSFIMGNCNNGGQRDQLSFWLALVRQLTVSREIKSRCKSHFSQKNKPGISGVLEDVRLREVGKHLPVRTTRRHYSTSKHEARTNIMCSHWKVPLCDTHASRNSIDTNSPIIRSYWT